MPIHGTRLRELILLAIMTTSCAAPVSAPSGPATGAPSTVPTLATSPVAVGTLPASPGLAAPTAGVAAAAAPAPVVSVMWLNVDSAGLLRFVAEVQNQADRTLEGAAVRWDALDASGAVVGGVDRSLPRIPPRGTYVYVGGAGTLVLTGRPERVQIRVTNPGRLSDAAAEFFEVEAVEFAPQPFSTGDQQEFRVYANVTTGAVAVRQQDISVSAILRDAGGQVVSANFTTITNLGETVAPGTKFRAEIPFIPTTAPPATAHVLAYSR